MNRLEWAKEKLKQKKAFLVGDQLWGYYVKKESLKKQVRLTVTIPLSLAPLVIFHLAEIDSLCSPLEEINEALREYDKP